MLQFPILGFLVRRPSELVMQIWSRCFPQTLHQYNLISHCLQQRSREFQNVLSFFGLAGFLDEIAFVSQVLIPLAKRLRRKIFSKATPVFDLPRRKSDTHFFPRDHWAYRFPYPTESSHKLVMKNFSYSSTLPLRSGSILTMIIAKRPPIQSSLTV